MLDILSITAPVFLLILLGLGATSLGMIKRPDARILGTYVLNFALPAVVFRAVSKQPFERIFNFDYLLAYGLGSLAAFVIALLMAWKLFGKSLNISALHGLGSSASNSGFIGYSIAVMVAHESAALAFALNMIVENCLILPLSLILAEGRKPGASVLGSIGRMAFDLLKRPMILGLLAGVALSISGLELPSMFTRSLDMLAAAAAPTALFVIGTSLGGLRLGGMLRDVLHIVGGKLLLHPLAVWAAMFLVPDLDPVLRSAGILFAAVPMMTIFPLLAQPYKQEDMCAAALMLATIVSFFTISALLAAIHAGL